MKLTHKERPLCARGTTRARAPHIVHLRYGIFGGWGWGLGAGGLPHGLRVRLHAQPSRGCWGTRGKGRGLREACKMRMRSSCRAWAAGFSSGTRLAVLPGVFPGGAASPAGGALGVGDGAARLRIATAGGPSVPATPKPGGIDGAKSAGRAAVSAPQSIDPPDPPTATEATVVVPMGRRGDRRTILPRATR